MKKIIYSLLMLVAVGMTFSSCSEDRDSNPTFNPNDVKSFTLNMPGYALNNAYDLEHSEYLVLTTSQPDYGFPVSTVYTVWVSLDNEHFENLATTSTNTYISVPASELNEKILTMAGDKDLSQPIPLYVYLTAHVYGNETLGEAQSNTITLPKVQAYVPVVEIALPQMMYIVGSFPASDGWSKFVPLSQAFSQDGFYYGVVYLPSGSEFKINQDAGWKGNDKGYGQLTVTDDAGAGLSSADASNDAANIKVANGGWYNIIVKGKIANGALLTTKVLGLLLHSQVMANSVCLWIAVSTGGRQSLPSRMMEHSSTATLIFLITGLKALAQTILAKFQQVRRQLLTSLREQVELNNESPSTSIRGDPFYYL